MPSGRYYPRVSYIVRTWLLILFVACSTSARAQDLAVVRGDVTAAGGNPIERARVLVLTDDLSDTLAVLFTNAQGHYEQEVATNVANEAHNPRAADRFWISALFPNPVGASTNEVSVRYTTPFDNPSAVPTAELFDVVGRRVDPSMRLGSGVYFLRLHFGDKRYTQPRSIVLASAASVSFQIRQELGAGASSAASNPASSPAARPSASKTAESGSASKRLASILRVEKDGYVKEEVSADLTAGTPTEVDFELDLAALPTAAFTIAGSTQSLEATLFDASSSAGANQEDLMYSWTFDDSQMGGGVRISHIYTEGGTYDVTLTVVGDHGAKASTTQQITIDAPPPPVATDGDLSGVISDVGGFVLEDVAVTIVGSDKSGLTNQFGEVNIENVDVGRALNIRLTRPGYATQVMSVGVPADSSSTLFFEATMRARDTGIEIADVENGAMKRARDGVMVELPVDALMRSDGSMATGSVNVSMTPINVSDDDEIGGFPGRFEGIAPNGEDGPLLSYGTAEFVFEQNGEELQLAPGKMANIEIPIYTTEAAVGDTIPYWSMNEMTSSWVQEGLGIVKESQSSPSGLALAATVGHFSWWNCDDFGDEDPNEAEGLCFKYECFSGICNKVKVFCWVEGARREQAGKKSELLPPAYLAREFVPEDGKKFLIPGNGTYTFRGTVIQNDVVLRGDTTFFAAAGGTSRVELVLDTVATASSISIPFDTTDTLENLGAVDVYKFSGSEGQLVAISAQLLSSAFRPGGVEVLDPQGNRTSTVQLDGEVVVFTLPETGDYSIIVNSIVDDAWDYRLIGRTVSATIPINSNSQLDVPWPDFRLLQFNPQPGQTLNVGIEKVGATLPPQVTVLDSSGTRVVESRNRAETGNFVTQNSPHFLVVQGRASGEDIINFGLAENDPESTTTVVLDGFGGADVESTVSYHGQYRYFDFEASEGDGLEISLRKAGEAAEVLQFDLLDPDRIRMSNGYHNAWTEDDLYTFGSPLTKTGTYRIVTLDRVEGSIGDFSVRIRRVSAATAIVVDDDLQCASAITTSVSAAVHALQENGTVTVCDGLYESPSRITMNGNGKSLVGESLAGVTVQFVDRNRSPGAVIDVMGQDATVRNMKLQTGPTQISGGVNAIVTFNSVEGTSALFEDLSISPIEESQPIGMAVRGDYTDVVVRNVTYERGFSSNEALNIRASGTITIDNSEFNSPITLTRLSQDNPTISVDGLTLDGASLNLLNAFDAVVENSIIDGQIFARSCDAVTIRNNQFLAESFGAVPGVKLERNVLATVEGNDTETRFEASVGDGGRVVIAANRFRETTSGYIMSLNQLFSTTAGIIEVQNNIISATRNTNGNIQVSSTENMAELLFANNTIVHEQLGTSVATVPTVKLFVRDNTVTGALPVVFVNNLLVGDNTTAFSLPVNTTVDSDYNLFYNFDSIFIDGSTSTGGNDLFGSNPLIANDDYQIMAGSPALNSGATPAQYSGVPSTDFLGVSRPQGGGFDRGAYEGSVSGAAFGIGRTNTSDERR